MKKRTFIVLSFLFLAFILVGCGGGSKKEPLTDIEIKGIEDKTFVVETPFDVMEGVTATGNDGVDYTDKIVVSSVREITNNKLNTNLPGTVVISYTIDLEEEHDLIVKKYRNITIEAKQKPEGEFLSNGDFSDGVNFWETYGGAGVVDISVEEGALKAVVSAVGDVWEPRITQMGVPFKKDQAYKISFRAKALEQKTINIQLGEILADAPWFTDFKPGQTEHFIITTEWAEYSFEFLHVQDNDRGGILFEMGTVAGDNTTTTVYLDDIVIEETTLSEDTVPPVITAQDVEVLVGAVVDLEALISVHDARDGDIPFADLVIEIKNPSGEVKDAIDTEVIGEWTVKVTAKDSKNNEATKSFTVKVIEMTFSDENIIVNGDFSQPLADPAEWGTYVPDWEPLGEVLFNVDNTAKEATLDVTKVGYELWHVQFFQNDVALEGGKTYMVKFDGKATVARDFALEIADAIDADNPVKFLGQTVSLTTEMATYKYVFTVHQPVQMGKINFLLGTGEAAKFTFTNIGIYEATNVEVEPVGNLIKNGLFDAEDGAVDPFVFENASGDVHGNMSIVDGKLVINVTSVGDEAYIPHLFQMLPKINPSEYSFKMIINSSVARTLRLNFVLPDQGFRSLLSGNFYDIVIGEEDVNKDITVEFDLSVGAVETNVKFELDFGPIDGVGPVGTYTITSIELLEK